MLSRLDLYISAAMFGIKPGIFYSLGQNKYFFSRLQDLSVRIESKSCIKNAIALFRLLANDAKKINNLTFDTDIHEPQLCHTFTSIVKSQEQLRRLDLID